MSEMALHFIRRNGVYNKCFTTLQYMLFRTVGPSVMLCSHVLKFYEKLSFALKGLHNSTTKAKVTFELMCVSTTIDSRG